jgi:hypothetical protein
MKTKERERLNRWISFTFSLNKSTYDDDDDDDDDDGVCAVVYPCLLNIHAAYIG